jgi:hypothetical protein
LLLTHQVHGVELIAIDGRELELQVPARIAHARLQLGAELVVPAVEEQADCADLLRIVRAIHLVHARRWAALDLVLQTRPPSHLELAIGAGAQLKVLFDQVERAARRGRGVVGAEVARFVGVRAPHQLEPRPRVLLRDPQVQVLLVVAQLDVEARLVLFDETVLEDRRFLLGGGDDGLEVADRLAKERDECARVSAAVLEVAADARPQALGLAHVQHFPVLVLEQVTTRAGRKALKLLCDGLGQHGSEREY